MISHSGFLCKTKVQQGVELSFIFNGKKQNKENRLTNSSPESYNTKADTEQVGRYMMAR